MSGEVDFMIKGYAKLDFLGHEVYITSTHICTDGAGRPSEPG